MFEHNCVCPHCHKLYIAWSHLAAPDMERDENGLYVLVCTDCSGPVINLYIPSPSPDPESELPAWLNTLAAQHQASEQARRAMILRTSPMDNLAREYPDLFDDLDDEELDKALAAFCEAQ